MNYGDKHTEDSLVSRLGRLYGIERGLDCGGYTSYSASMIPDHCNIFDSLMREVIMGAARVVYISDGGLGALRSLDRMSKAITHARRETRFRAGEERVESDD